MKKIPIEERTPQLIEDTKKKVQEGLVRTAAATFNGELNNYIENVRREHEQIIDSVNIDSVTKSEWDKSSIENAEIILNDFKSYLELHKDEIKALSIFYNQPYNRREITFNMIKEVMDKLRLDKPFLAPVSVWNAYATVEEVKSECPKDELTALVSLIRRVCGIDSELTSYDKTIETNFKNWIFKQNAGQHNRFTQEQMDWLRLIKDHVISSYHIETSDFDNFPFDKQGGIGKMYKLFGNEMNQIINELNEVLAA